MDEQRTDRESGRGMSHRPARAVRQIAGAAFVGALALGALFGLIGLNYALHAGPDIPIKGSRVTYSALSWVAQHFFGGAVFGAICGVAGAVILLAFDRLKKLFPTT